MSEEWDERHGRWLADEVATKGVVEVAILFDGPPGPEAGRFIEVEDAVTGESIDWGQWMDNRDGTWSLCGVVVRKSAGGERT